MRPVPRRGTGGARGGLHTKKRGFLQSTKNRLPVVHIPLRKHPAEPGPQNSVAVRPYTESLTMVSTPEDEVRRSFWIGIPGNAPVLKIPYDERHSGIPKSNHASNDCPREGTGRDKKRFLHFGRPALAEAMFISQLISTTNIFPLCPTTHGNYYGR